MTNDDNFLSKDLDVSLEKEFPRLTCHRADDLYRIARRVFSRKADQKDIECQVINLHQVLDLIAGIISKTYVECGDSFRLADDEALILIRDQLVQYNPFIIIRNKSKRIY